MRFSTSLIAAGLATSIFAAPVAERQEEEYDECDADYPTSVPAGLGQQTSTSIPAPFKATKTETTRAPSSSAATIPTSQSSVVVVVSTASVPVESASSTEAASIDVTTPSTTATTATTAQATQVSPSKASSVAATSASSIPAVTSSSATSSAATSTSTGALQWIGADESGAEFGSALPGVLGTDYTWPNTSAIQILMDKGMNIFRIPILMERIAQGTMTATLDATYLASLTTVVEYITAAGGHAVIDPHNYGRYDGTIFTSTSDFKTFWTNLATPFKSNDNVIFDCNNEFHDEPSNAIVAELNQACIDGVRAAGATTQYVFVEGTVSH